MSEKIIVTISPSGETEVKVEGFRGKGCKAITEGLEAALGAKVGSKNTSEYAQSPALQQGQGQTAKK